MQNGMKTLVMIRILTLNEFLAGFKKKWGEKKELRHLLAALHDIKKMENETMDEFNT